MTATDRMATWLRRAMGETEQAAAAVLRRVTADRKLLDLHQNVDGKCYECGQGYELSDWGPNFPCATVRLLAEGYGWTEEK